LDKPDNDLEVQVAKAKIRVTGIEKEVLYWLRIDHSHVGRT